MKSPIIKHDMIARRSVLAGGLALLAAPALGQTRPKARPDRAQVDSQNGGQAGGQSDQKCREAIAAARLGGEIGYIVADTGSGAVLGSYQAKAPMPPASVTKALTTLYVRERLGPSYRFSTRLMATGPLQNGELQGDLILAGRGDPSLDTDRLGDLAAALAGTGLRKIKGRFLVWGGALPYIERVAVDQPDFVGYNPAISGIMLNFNRANFVWAAKDGKLALDVNAEGTRFIPPVRVVDVALSPRQAPLFVYESKTPIEQWSVAAPALRKDGSRWLPVRAPVAYAGDVFGTLCAAQGITLPKPAEVAGLPDGARVLVQDRSDSLDPLLRGMLKYSTNLTAEAIGLAASRAANIAASGAAMSAWAQTRFGITAQFGDHSGLGPNSACTPADMLRVMLGAQSGALAGLMRERRIDTAGREAADGPLRVAAKSGTMNFTSNLAGYVFAPSGRTLAFAIFAADSPRRAALPVSEREDPKGGEAWNKRARAMQRQMIAAWAAA